MARYDDDDGRVVIVEREGLSSVKVFLFGALLGAGLALLYAPAAGDDTRRGLKKRMRRMRAMAEEKVEELTDRFQHDGDDELEDDELEDDELEGLAGLDMVDGEAGEEDEDGEEEEEDAVPARTRGGARAELERRLNHARARRRRTPEPVTDDEEAGA